MNTYHFDAHVHKTIQADSLEEARHKLDVELSTRILGASAFRVTTEKKHPDLWKVGMVVEAVSDSDFAWSKGSILVVNEVREEYAKTPGHEYQVFYTSHLKILEGESGLQAQWSKKNGTFWTTPNDVTLLADSVDEFLTNRRDHAAFTNEP